MRNTFGNILRLTTFGESHGPAIGGVLDGFPAGVPVSPEAVQRQLDRRRPGQSHITTARRESDTVQLLSGIFEGQSLGTPIGFIIPNTDHRSADYSEIAHSFRPSHADYTYQAKYGIRDYRGGGRASARETACRVVAGALAQQALARLSITITAYTSQIADVKFEGKCAPQTNVDANLVRCPDAAVAQLMTQAIERAQAQGDTVGGTVSCVITGVPAGLGEPVFGRLSAQLADAMMSINAAKGFEIGDGFDIVNHLGSEVIDHFVCRDGKVTTLTNHSGGVQGGISNGQDITFTVAFKPVATLMRDIDTIDDQGRPVTLHARGRHDPCVVPRAVPIVEAMAALVILDNYLLQKTARL